MDIFIAVALVLNQRRQDDVSKNALVLRIIIWIYFFFVIVSETLGAIRYQFYLESIYMFIRFCLAVSLFFSLNRIVESCDDLLLIIKATLLGLIITAGIIMLSSLPPTRPLAVKYIFSNPMLEPAFEIAIRQFGGGIERGMRGRSLVGVSNMSGGFICTLWPFAFLVFLWKGMPLHWRAIALFACLLAPFGAIMTYSRSAVISLILVIMMLACFGAGGIKRYVILFVAFAVFGISVIGWNSELFFFERLIKSTSIALDDPLEREDESERVMSYVEPFIFVLERPDYLVAGEGGIRTKITIPDQVLGYSRNMATHSAFASAFYTYGLLAAFCNVLMVGTAFLVAYQNMVKAAWQSETARMLASVTVVCLMGMLPWWSLGHGAVSAPRGAMFFFLVLGVVTVIEKLIDQVAEMDEATPVGDYSEM